MSNSMETAGIVTGKTAVYGGAATAVASGMTLSEMGIVVGGVVGLLGFIFGQYWAWRRDARQRLEADERKAERALRISLMRASGRPIYHQDTDLGKLETES